jgi:hypothetical protein
VQVGQEPPDVAGGAVEAADGHVDLDPVAGGDDHRLVHVLQVEQAGQGLGPPLGVDGQALQQLKGALR